MTNFCAHITKGQNVWQKREDDQHTLNPGKGDNAIIHKGNSYLLSIISNEMAHTQNK